MRWKFWKRDASVAEEIEDKPVAKPRLQAAVRRTFSGLVLFVLALAILGWWWDSEPDHFDVGYNGYSERECQAAPSRYRLYHYRDRYSVSGHPAHQARWLPE